MKLLQTEQTRQIFAWNRYSRQPMPIAVAKKKKRQRIDTLIDAHLWMRRQEARLKRRPPTPGSVPDDLLGTNALARLNLEIVLRSLD